MPVRGLIGMIALVGVVAFAGSARAQGPIREALPIPRPLPGSTGGIPFLPNPRELLPPPAPFIPPRDLPKLVPVPTPGLVALAAESSHWVPAYEPQLPTPGLWGKNGPSSHPRSWQEWSWEWRDMQTWLYTSPTCCAGVRAPANSSAWNWATQWMPDAWLPDAWLPSWLNPIPNGTCGGCAVAPLVNAGQAGTKEGR